MNPVLKTDEHSGADPIDAWVNQPIPEKLWHYTSVQGFQGIISSGKIFATDVRFLNDAEEFIHARKIAHELADSAPQFGDMDFHLRDSIKWVVKQIFESDFLDPNKAQIFVASFTDSEDDLSQWRAYSHRTPGVSIGFDLRSHRPPEELESAITFAPCIYSDDQKRALISSALQHFIEVAQSKWTDLGWAIFKKHEGDKRKPTQTQIAKLATDILGSKDYQTQLVVGFRSALSRIVRLAGLLKHRAFHHEREWRLVLPISPGKDKGNLPHPIQFRSAITSLIPHIEFPLSITPIQSPSGSLPPFLPVRDVMLGPGTSREAEIAALDFMKSNSISVAPRRSDVPYRQS